MSSKSKKIGKSKKVSREKKAPGTGFVFFVPDQGEGAAKYIVIALKILMLVITTIFALVLGIFGPLCVWNPEAQMDAAGNPGVLTWLISSCVYIVGTFVIMLGHSRIASVIDIIAAAGSLVTYYLFETSKVGSTPTPLYMPCVALTVLAVVIAMLINIPKWLEKQAEKANEKAPSIIDDSDD